MNKVKRKIQKKFQKICENKNKNKFIKLLIYF